MDSYRLNVGFLNGSPADYSHRIIISASRRLRLSGIFPMLRTVPGQTTCNGRRIHGWLGFVSPQIVASLQASGVPVVNVSQAHGPVPFPSVLVDNIAAGRQAAEHLVERGFRQVVYIPRPTLDYSPLRGRGVKLALQAHGLVYEELVPDEKTKFLTACRRFLRRLQQPTGVIGADDALATVMLDAALLEKASVPNQLAVVGITNDILACEVSTPPLSSVDLSPDIIGERAADLLVRLLGGEPAPREALLVAPRGVAMRESSDSLAVADPWVAKVVSYARRHIEENLTAASLARKFGISESQMLRNFRDKGGWLPRDVLQRIRVEHAKNLLSHTALPIKEIAGRCGYGRAQHFGRLFRKLTGTTPAAYRQAYQFPGR